MKIKKLYTFKVVDGKVKYTQQEYKVWENNGLFTVSNIEETEGCSNMPKILYERVYGEDLSELIYNRRKWLVENVLPNRINHLKEVNDEVMALSDFLNE